ncbi:hypothetical protein BTUL_0009g00080 [Botrytis tulipae]|uniref:Uncharacterized protein n=1 Tax=Botrytis tulipae TaxID=87230 RepID=A0A4Z1F458_9HELO|nr:hypothetical protein BTUL_0009g00080 [Botrytis tulipae]
MAIFVPMWIQHIKCTLGSCINTSEYDDPLGHCCEGFFAPSLRFKIENLSSNWNSFSYSRAKRRSLHGSGQAERHVHL